MSRTLTAAEVRAIREGLGVTAEWLADHLGVTTRAVQRWESGQNRAKDFVTDALLLLEAEAAEQVAAHLDAFNDAPAHVPALLAIGDRGHDTWPSGWQRMVAFRVRQQLPGLRIIDTSDPGTPLTDDIRDTDADADAPSPDAPLTRHR